MNIRRSLSLSILLAVVAAPTLVGCAADSPAGDGEGNTDAQSAALGKAPVVDPGDNAVVAPARPPKIASWKSFGTRSSSV